MRTLELQARKAAASGITLKRLATKAVLGVGTFGTVRLVQDTSTKNTYALKCMRKAKVYEMGQVLIR